MNIFSKTKKMMKKVTGPKGTRYTPEQNMVRSGALSDREVQMAKQNASEMGITGESLLSKGARKVGRAGLRTAKKVKKAVGETINRYTK